jgi:ribosomal protein S18 acetylase RimI-like enzyme
MIEIRPFANSDWPALWPLLQATMASGDTYAFSPTITEAEMRAAWVQPAVHTFVALDESGQLVGTYILKANQPGLGSHVCNCGYVVAARARGQGVAQQLCEHSQVEARRLGFRAMQFNLVVETNATAVRLWQRLGFAIIGTLPEAFLHSTHGLVGAHVMYKKLV